LDEAVSNLDVQKGRRQALVVVLSQVLLGVIVAGVCFAIAGSRAGASALLGAGIGVAATSLMAFALLRHGEGATLARATVGFFLGWLVKVGFTIASERRGGPAARSVRRDVLRVLVWGGSPGRAHEETIVRSEWV
jgi:hypothetical protein